MMKLIQGYFGLCLLCIMFYTPAYVLFFNSVEDKVEKTTFVEAIIAENLTIYRNDEKVARMEKDLAELRTLLKDNIEFDLYDSMYDFFKNSKHQKDFKIISKNSVNDAEKIDISFTYNGKKIVLEYIVRKPEFWKVRTAQLGGVSASVNGINTEISDMIGALIVKGTHKK